MTGGQRRFFGNKKRCRKRFTCSTSPLKPVLGLIVPRAGVEPARVAPLVFETSASTDSAIWASVKNQREKSYLFSLVGIADEISNIKFIEDFDKIVNFILSTNT